MTKHTRVVFWMSTALLAGCAGPWAEQHRDAAPTIAVQKQRSDVAAPAITALQEGRFDEAAARAGEVIATDGATPQARVVRAVVHYKKTMHQLYLDGRTLLVGARTGSINHRYLHATLEQAEKDLAAVEVDLEAASHDPGISLELCLACWEVDWNGNGEVDDRDRRLFQIEQDEKGEPIPEGDPRRKPTFRFDAGDVAWARAFVSFERAAADVVLAYDFTEVDQLLSGSGHAWEKTIVIRLRQPERVAAARARVLEGLDRSDEARRSYLAETDDDREWMPSPRQRSHPMPLPVDQALYDTWEGVLRDVRHLVRGDEGLGAADLWALDGKMLEPRPHGFVDVGGMLARPRDITLNLGHLEDLGRAHDTEGMLATLFGDHYLPAMKASPLPGRLLRMKGEVDRSEEGFERKLRYLFWIN